MKRNPKLKQPADDDTAIAAERENVLALLSAVDRTAPHFKHVVDEYARLVVRLRRLRAQIAEEGEFIVSDGRHGRQIKAHPAARQLNEAFRQWLALTRALGFSPASDRALQVRGPSLDGVAYRIDEDPEFG